MSGAVVFDDVVRLLGVDLRLCPIYRLVRTVVTGNAGRSCFVLYLSSGKPSASGWTRDEVECESAGGQFFGVVGRGIERIML